jgi:Carboxypeptidase regulatory-like domain
MKRSTVVVAAFFAMGISSAVAAQQQAASVTLRGRVVRASDGAPVAGADVWLVSSQLQVQTDSAGSFTFTGLAPGSQLLQIRHIG